jgi:hypothetical protein
VITSIDYNPMTSTHTTCSKNTLFISDFKNATNFSKLPNFQFHKNFKVTGMFSNINSGKIIYIQWKNLKFISYRIKHRSFKEQKNRIKRHEKSNSI